MNHSDTTPQTSTAPHDGCCVVTGIAGETVVELPGSVTTLRRDAYGLLFFLHMLGWAVTTDAARGVLDDTVRVVAGQPGATTWWCEVLLSVSGGTITHGHLHQPNTTRALPVDGVEQATALLSEHRDELRRWMARARDNQGVRPQFRARPGDVLGFPAQAANVPVVVDHNLGDGHLVVHAVNPDHDKGVHHFGTPYADHELTDGQIKPTVRRRNEHRAVVINAFDASWIVAQGVAV
jgi:hypothetical protein